MKCAVFCKSFRDDFDRLRHLVSSFQRFVEPPVEMLISVPQDDMAGARHLLADRPRITLICDDDYTDPVGRGMGGWVHQQLCKLSVHRTGFADSYFALDSDSYFIRSFGPEDFCTDEGLPRFVASPVFTVYQPHNGLLFHILDGDEVPSLPVIEAAPERPKLNLDGMRAAVAAQVDGSPGARGPLLDHIFGAALRRLAFQPSQFLIAEALRLMEEDLAAQTSSFSEILSLAPWEYNWYGSYCMFARPVACAPSMSPTLGFVKAEMVMEARAKGMSHASLARHFAAIQMAARHHDETSLDA